MTTVGCYCHALAWRDEVGVVPVYICTARTNTDALDRLFGQLGCDK